MTHRPPNVLGARCRKCGADNWTLKRDGSRRCRACASALERARMRREPHRTLFYNARARAELNGTPFALELSDVAAMLGAARACVYCGRTLRRSSMSGGGPASPTLDRVTPDSGYTLGNVVVACHGCNAAKAGHTPASLRDFADRIERVMRGAHGQDTRHET